jgi:hypothetical protein
MKLPLALRIKARSSATERGPSARRGLQFSDASLPDLLESLAKSQATLRRIDSLESYAEGSNAEVMKLRTMSADELAALRKEMISLQSDLRAELRRRGAYY